MREHADGRAAVESTTAGSREAPGVVERDCLGVDLSSDMDRRAGSPFGTDPATRPGPTLDVDTAVEVDRGQAVRVPQPWRNSRRAHGRSAASAQPAERGQAALEHDYSLIRQHIAAVIPGFEDFEKSIADISGTPTSKSVVIRLEHRPARFVLRLDRDVTGCRLALGGTH